MARPAVSAKVTAKHLTNDEKNTRIGTEEKLRGNTDELTAPPYLSGNQAEIFSYIVRNLENSGILGNLDVFVLTECCICIDRMQTIEKQINENPEKLADSRLIAVKDRYSRNFQRYCNELCLSPQSRAKIANINIQGKEENPLLEILSDD
ncbi:MAG: P27 family phage terminase small subunit [Ruminococcus flavefaciens]|nr:P27 family phage terminase small subunit [Ruminococcus flavefaciens]MCM1232652.1 P27 family phage terminase small subunit [Ruminococcus flavefaciens]